MHQKIREHLDEALGASREMEEAWAMQDYVLAGIKAAEIAKIATHDCETLSLI